MAKHQTTDPDLAARRARVAALRGTMTNRAMAERLGVGETTVRRDLAALDAERAAAEQTAASAPAAEPRHDAPPRRRLELEVDDALADALRTLVAAVPGARHDLANYRAAARAAIRSVADTIREEQRATTAHRAPSGRAAAPRARVAP
ncbi:DeoR family transcriptional regulator [Streptomyces sp. BB1-1-1]|uniref:DeoR family transcriptional regulator n=1 Tax=Streptomyces sp. BB1-1-1 TaxID=3074430 RepID=UPI0028778DB6|nr:DeoR family transcriptional regulator [Streptomyces sp. BB1-1-1]WND36935.1 DeoR family transcriptional regulator [Streptomyces sp. BB1-1-1]